MSFYQGKYVHPIRRPGVQHKWRKFRKMYLQDNPLCVKCSRQAQVLDHRVPLKYKTATMEDIFDRTNLQGLCKQCNSEKTAEDNRRARPQICYHGFRVVDGKPTCLVEGCQGAKERSEGPPSGGADGHHHGG